MVTKLEKGKTSKKKEVSERKTVLGGEAEGSRVRGEYQK